MVKLRFLIGRSGKARIPQATSPKRTPSRKRLVDGLIGIAALIVGGIVIKLCIWEWNLSSDRYILQAAQERLMQRVDELEKAPRTWVDRQEWNAAKETFATRDDLVAVEKRLTDQIVASSSRPQTYSTWPQPTFKESPLPWVVSTPVPWTLRVDNLTGAEQFLDVNGRTYSIPLQGTFIPVSSEGLLSCELRSARMAKIVSITAPTYFEQIQIVNAAAPLLR
jgi:hypothetical protein